MNTSETKSHTWEIIKATKMISRINSPNISTLLIAFLLFARVAFSATTYTEFYCDATASVNNSNIFSGSTTGAPVYRKVNMNWDGTSVFTPTDGTTTSATVSAGMWAAIFTDGATNLVQSAGVGGFIALITNVAAGANGAITIDRAAFAGTAPSSSATARSINVGGCWQGPYRTINFPFGFIATTATNGTGILPRVNFKNSANYAITASIANNVNGPYRFQGYSSTVGDGGRATIDGGSSGTSYTMLNNTGSDIDFEDFIFQNNGSTGLAAGVQSTSGARAMFRRCVVNSVRGVGFNLGIASVIECEAYSVNQSGTAATGAFTAANVGYYRRCVSHNNGAGTSGFKVSISSSFDSCIAAFNSVNGALFSVSASQATFTGCDFYNNTKAGIEAQADNQTLFVENCNFIKNQTFGITNNGSLRHGAIVNCGFGTGSQANPAGDIVVPGGIIQIGNFSYASGVTPWVDPDNGDYRIILSAAKSSGRGNFTETQAGYSGTVGYPDVGAAQSASTNGGFSATFAQ